MAKILRPTWVTVTLLSLIISVVVGSIEDAHWIQDESPLTASLLLGVVFGLLLSKSRFRPWFVILYALFISLIIPLQSIGRVVPSLGQFFVIPLPDVLNGMNVRLWTFYIRASGWLETWRAGENIKDTGLFVVLLGSILALGAIWLMWAVIRRRRALEGVLPLGILMAINVHLDRQPLTNFMIFLFAVLLLQARTSFSEQNEDWNRRRIDYPEQLGLEWSGSALALAIVIIFFARSAPLLGTPDGWQAISEWVNRAHEETSTTATRLFSGVNPPPPNPTQKKTVYVHTPDMGRIGAPIAKGEDTVMWVKISDAPPPPPDVNAYEQSESTIRTHYWRNAIYSTYNGRGWGQAQLTADTRELSVLREKPPVGRYYLTQQFEFEAVNTGHLFAVSEPIKTGGSVSLRDLQVGGSQLVEGQASNYQVISEATDVSANMLIEASKDYPPDIRAVYLQLPDELPARVRSMAERLTAGVSDPYHKALRIQNYLRENYKYDVNVPESPADKDAVDYFLFDATGGFCSHYASSMAVLLRAVGVPARIATGYAMGYYDYKHEAFRVSESAAHAWVEVYFPGYGWIEFEPTAVRPVINYLELTRSSLNQTPSTAAENNPALKTKPYFVWLVLFGAVLLLAMPFLLLRMFSASRQPPVIQVTVLYRRMRRMLAWAGLEAAPSMTPDEYLARYTGQLQAYSHLQRALGQATSLYRETTFSPHPPDERRVRVASQLWQNSFRDWLVLWLKAFWARLRVRVKS